MSCYAAAVDSMAAHDGPPPQELLLQLPPMPMSIPAAAGIPPPAQQPPPPPPQQSPFKRKRSLPGTPDPEAEVIALSPKTLMATNRFVCEICNKGFQRDQNLQLHRRGHNLPWKLRQRSSNEEQQLRKRVYVCPEPSCVHHDPSRALGDLTGIKKHFCRKHGEKKWKCDKCSKRYAVYSDWKAHSKICGTREYRCDCGTLFSRRDSFITHRAFCDSLAAVDDSGRGAGAALSADLPLPLDFTRNISPFYHQRSHNNNNNNSNNNNNTTAGVSSISGSIGLNTMQIMQSLHMDSSANFFLQYLSSGGGAPNVNSNSSGSSSSNMLRYQYQYQYQADSNNSRFLSSSSHNPAQESLPLPPPPDNKFHHHHHHEQQQQQESLSAMALLMQRNGHMASSLSAAPGGSSSANTMFKGLGLLGSDSSKSNSTSSSSSNHHLNHNQTHSHSHSRQQQHHHHINNKNQDHHQPQQQWQHNNNQYIVQEDENNNPAAAAEEAASRDLVQQWHWQWQYHNRQVSVDAAAAAHLVSGADDAEGTRDFLSVAMAPSHDFTREAETEIEAEVERAGPFHGRPPPPPPYLAVHLPPHISPGNLSSSSSSFEKIPSL